MILLLIGTVASLISIAMMDNVDPVVSALGGVVLLAGVLAIMAGQRQLRVQQNK